MPKPAEYYADLLAVISWIEGNTQGVQARILLGEKLRERKAEAWEDVVYLARKRQIEPEDLWNQILKGDAEPIGPDEIAD